MYSTLRLLLGCVIGTAVATQVSSQAWVTAFATIIAGWAALRLVGAGATIGSRS